MSFVIVLYKNEVIQYSANWKWSTVNGVLPRDSSSSSSIGLVHTEKDAEGKTGTTEKRNIPYTFTHTHTQTLQEDSCQFLNPLVKQGAQYTPVRSTSAAVLARSSQLVVSGNH